MKKPGESSLFSVDGLTPRIDPTAFVAPGARLIGEVSLAPRASVWFNAVLRADLGPIELGEGANVQDLTTVHVEGEDEVAPGAPMRGTRIGRFTTIGHNCVIHSCDIEEDCLIGMHATVMNGAVIGHGSIVGAGALVLENTIVPPFSLVVGNPGKVRKTYPPDIIERVIRRAADSYMARVDMYTSRFELLEPA